MPAIVRLMVLSLSSASAFPASPNLCLLLSCLCVAMILRSFRQMIQRACKSSKDFLLSSSAAHDRPCFLSVAGGVRTSRSLKKPHRAWSSGTTTLGLVFEGTGNAICDFVRLHACAIVAVENFMSWQQGCETLVHDLSILERLRKTLSWNFLGCSMHLSDGDEDNL